MNPAQVVAFLDEFREVLKKDDLGLSQECLIAAKAGIGERTAASALIHDVVSSLETYIITGQLEGDSDAVDMIRRILLRPERRHDE